MIIVEGIGSAGRRDERQRAKMERLRWLTGCHIKTTNTQRERETHTHTHSHTKAIVQKRIAALYSARSCVLCIIPISEETRRRSDSPQEPANEKNKFDLSVEFIIQPTKPRLPLRCPCLACSRVLYSIIYRLPYGV